MNRDYTHRTSSLVSILGVVGSEGGISTDADLMWNIGEDTDWFNRKTEGGVIVMSWETFERMGTKPLPNRINVVVNKNIGYKVPKGVILCRSVQEVLKEFKEIPEIIIVGGVQTYAKFLPVVSQIHLAIVEQSFGATRFFPDVDWKNWEVVEHIKRRPEVGLSYSFNTYKRKEGGR